MTLYIYLRRWHRALREQVSHRALDSAQTRQAYESGDLPGLPQILLKTSDSYRYIYDTSSIPHSTLPLPDEANLEHIFTQLPRRNLTCFAHFPQSYMMRLLARSPEQQRSFSQSHIAALNFEPGDLFCGGYRVARQTAGRVEVAIELPMQIEMREQGTRRRLVAWSSSVSNPWSLARS